MATMRRICRWCGAPVLPALLAMSAFAGGERMNEPILPVPAAAPQHPARVALGRRLFSDGRLSGNGVVSCASCHDVKKGGADSSARSIGFSGRLTALNTPTVFNAALNFRQFWNGRASTLEQQVGMVVENPVEMGAKWPDVVRKVAADGSYRQAFGSAYRDGVTRANIENALASYERTLVTPDSRFDRYLKGDGGAITTMEKAGYLRFKQYGCVSCHQGVNVGGNMFQKYGVVAAPPLAQAVELGRFRLTGKAQDKHVFKVPGLRNVARTAPYFHDGSAATLDQAIAAMFRYQLGRESSSEDRQLIAAFLATLNAEPEGQP